MLDGAYFLNRNKRVEREEKDPHILQDAQQLRDGAGKNACYGSSLASLEALKSSKDQSLLAAGQGL